MKAEEFDQKFDDGEDVSGDLDLAAVRRPGPEQRRVNVDFPAWMIECWTGRSAAGRYPPVYDQGLDRRAA